MVGGNPQGLARAEREIGLRSEAVAVRSSSFRYETDRVLCEPDAGRLWNEIKRWQLLGEALTRFDVIHFNFGRTILPTRIVIGSQGSNGPRRTSRDLQKRLYNFYAGIVEHRDLPLLKRGGKAVVVTFQGDDARQGDRAREMFDISPAHEVGEAWYPRELDVRKRQAINRFEQYADKLFALNPDLLHVLPPGAEFLPYASVDPRRWRPNTRKNRQGPPRVIHAPSHRGLKGTKHILRAVSRLEDEGVEFEFELIEGLTHQEARKAYQSADLLIDQLLYGWYGALSVELMSLGVPSICYIREGDLQFIPREMRAQLPLINATPTSIEDVLRTWLTSRKDELSDQGERSRAFVERWHDPIRVARKVRKAYEDALGYSDTESSAGEGAATQTSS